MATRRILVDGHVQGVGFRYHAQAEARRLGVVGEVWNRQDGRVECIASSDVPELLDKFEHALKLGPGRVAEVRSSEMDDRQYEDFAVEATRP